MFASKANTTLLTPKKKNYIYIMIYVSFNRENEHGRQPSPKSESKSKIPYVRQSSPKS
jgi:hypothetical protein